MYGNLFLFQYDTNKLDLVWKATKNPANQSIPSCFITFMTANSQSSAIKCHPNVVLTPIVSTLIKSDIFRLYLGVEIHPAAL